MTDTSAQSSNPYLNKSPESTAADSQPPVAETGASDAPSAMQTGEPAANAQLQSMIDLVDKLIDVLGRENELLAKPRSRELTPVVSEKQGLFAEYEGMLRKVGDFSALLAQVDPGLKKVLSERAKVFEVALKENEAKLDAMVRTSQQIMKVMSDVAKKMAKPVQGYGNSGAVSGPGKTLAPVAVNQTL